MYVNLMSATAAAGSRPDFFPAFTSQVDRKYYSDDCQDNDIALYIKDDDYAILTYFYMALGEAGSGKGNKVIGQEYIHEVQHVTDNNFAGHSCLHFPRTQEQVTAIGPYATKHQSTIDAGWAATQKMQ